MLDENLAMNPAKHSFSALVFLLMVATLAAGSNSGQTDKLKMYDDADGYAVLSKLLEPQGVGSETTVVDIVSPTVSAKEMWHRLGDCVQVPDEFQAAAKDFDGKATTRLELEDRFQLGVKHEIVKPRPITPSDYAKLRATGRTNFPQASNGWYYVAAVGFDADKTHAIAYVNFLCGTNCCGGTFHLLKKGARGWEEVKNIVKCTWMC